jgi:RNA polymerase sigma-70 factor (ECF subfamily)
VAMEQKEFIKLYDENVRAIFRYIFLRVSSKESAQDLTSEVFLRGWKKMITDYRLSPAAKINNPRAFLYKIAKNLIVDFYRQKSRTEISLEGVEIDIPDLTGGPSEKIELDLELEPIKKALAKIKNDYAEIIIWHYLDELTIPEIAEILDKSEGAARTMLSRALEKVRELV